MAERTGRVRVLTAVLLLFVLSLALRSATLTWGIPLDPFTGAYHPDEPATYEDAVRFPHGYLTSESFVYGSSLSYLVGAALLPFKSHLEPRTHALACYIGLRALSALLGALAVLATLRLGERTFDRRTGLISAALLAVSFAHTMNSSFATPHVAMSFLLVGVLLTTARAFERQRLRDFAAAGAVLGFLLGTKLSMAVVGVVPVVFAAMSLGIARGRSLREIAPQARRVLIWLIVMFVCTVVVFTAFNAHVVFQPRAYLTFWRVAKLQWFDSSATDVLRIPDIWWATTAQSVGELVAIAALVGLVIGGKGQLRLRVAVTVLLVAYYMSLRHYLLPRIVATVAPLLCVFAARALSMLLESGQRAVRVAGAAAVALALVASLYAVAWGIHIRRSDPRTLAARWIHAELPAGPNVAVASIYGRDTEWEEPRIDPARRAHGFLERPPFVVLSINTRRTMERALRSPNLLPGYRWDPALAREWHEGRPPSPDVFRFFDEVFGPTPRYELIKTFEGPRAPVEVEFAGLPTYVYRRK